VQYSAVQCSAVQYSVVQYSSNAVPKWGFAGIHLLYWNFELFFIPPLPSLACSAVFQPAKRTSDLACQNVSTRLATNGVSRQFAFAGALILKILSGRFPPVSAKYSTEV
jgi:hypothetical protein